MMGTGNALMLVEPFVQDAPFVVAYPDDIVMGDPPLTLQLIEAYKETGNTILTVEALPEEDISRYGVIDPVNEGEIMEVRQMVEKPAPGTEPSNYASYGRYLYTPEIFDALRATDNTHEHQGEFTQTEAINQLASKGKVSAVKMKGSRYDVGEPLGYLLSSLQFGLRQERFRETLILEMERMLQQDKN